MQINYDSVTIVMLIIIANHDTGHVHIGWERLTFAIDDTIVAIRSIYRDIRNDNRGGRRIHTYSNIDPFIP
jgi:hypothetical protein